MPKDVKIEDITVTTDLTSDLSSATVQVEVVYSVGPLGKAVFGYGNEAFLYKV
jgi:hypothetical protein